MASRKDAALEAASKAANATRKARNAAKDKASRMASVFKSKMRRSGGQHISQDAGADAVGRNLRCHEEDEENQLPMVARSLVRGEEPVGSTLRLSGPESSCHAERTDRSPTCSGSECSDAVSWPRNTPTTQSASMAPSESGSERFEVSHVPPEIRWDATKFGHVRPLQCSSIWDIPTSIDPNPVPQSVGVPSVSREETSCIDPLSVTKTIRDDSFGNIMQIQRGTHVPDVGGKWCCTVLVMAAAVCVIVYLLR